MMPAPPWSLFLSFIGNASLAVAEGFHLPQKIYNSPVASISPSPTKSPTSFLAVAQAMTW